MELPVNQIMNGNCLEILKDFPDECIDCIVTSPPYFGLRDNGEESEVIFDGKEDCNHEFETFERKIHSGNCKDNINPAVDVDGGYKTDWNYTDKYCKRCMAWKGQLGLEEHPQQYINHIIQIIKECKRILKSTGTIWLNLGDSFYTKSGSGQGNNYLKRHEELDGGRKELYKAHTQTRGKFKSNWLQSKQRLLIPSRIAIACQDELGLILRNDITWVKQIINWKTKESQGTSMPTSVQDRLNTNSESIFLFVKNPKYYFNLDAIRVPHKEVSIKRNNYGENDCGFKENVAFGRAKNPGDFLSSKGKNPGSCIIFPLEPSSENHYAMFPKTLPEFCIKAGCPEEVCNKCKKPREKILEHNKLNENGEDYLETKKTPYSVQERKGFVKIRKLPNLKEFSKYLNNKRKKTIEDIENYFGNQRPHHWFSGESYPAVEDYIKLKEFLKLDNKYDKLMIKEYYKPAEKQEFDYSIKGYTDCGCNEGFSPGIVLDPFAGGGTTLYVAKHLLRNYIGIELNSKYIQEIQKNKLAQEVLI